MRGKLLTILSILVAIVGWWGLYELTGKVAPDQAGALPFFFALLFVAVTGTVAPAAAYLAGAGLIEQGRFQAAIPFFQLVLDRYAIDGERNTIAFAAPEHQELVEASLCLLQYSCHRIGDMGRLSGVPHLMLQKMPVPCQELKSN